MRTSNDQKEGTISIRRSFKRDKIELDITLEYEQGKAEQAIQKMRNRMRWHFLWRVLVLALATIYSSYFLALAWRVLQEPSNGRALFAVAAIPVGILWIKRS